MIDPYPAVIGWYRSAVDPYAGATPGYPAVIDPLPGPVDPYAGLADPLPGIIDLLPEMADPYAGIIDPCFWGSGWAILTSFRVFRAIVTGPGWSVGRVGMWKSGKRERSIVAGGGDPGGWGIETLRLCALSEAGGRMDRENPDKASRRDAEARRTEVKPLMHSDAH
jgi:hypothetical protein